MTAAPPQNQSARTNQPANLYLRRSVSSSRLFIMGTSFREVQATK